MQLLQVTHSLKTVDAKLCYPPLTLVALGKCLSCMRIAMSIVRKYVKPYPYMQSPVGGEYVRTPIRSESERSPRSNSESL